MAFPAQDDSRLRPVVEAPFLLAIPQISVNVALVAWLLAFVGRVLIRARR